MTALLGALGLAGPTEGRFFGFLGIFGLAVAGIYWFVTYEWAGTVLLLGFGIVTALIGAVVASAAASTRGRGPLLPRAEAADGPAIVDESGRMPSPTLAPLAVGIGLSIAATAIVFGPAPLLVGAPPALWGFVTWLHRAVAEMRAVEHDDGSGTSGGSR